MVNTGKVKTIKVITPQEALASREPTITAEFQRFQPDIEQQLKIKSVARLETKNLGKYAEEVYEMIKYEYEGVGWKVKRERGYDQRDGEGWDYVVIYV